MALPDPDKYWDRELGVRIADMRCVEVEGSLGSAHVKEEHLAFTTKLTPLPTPNGPKRLRSL